MTNILLLTLAAIPLSLTSPASARLLADPPAWAAPGMAEAEDQTLNESELRDAMETAGYSEVRILRADGDLYELSARKDGRSVLLRVNAQARRYSERPAN